MSKTEEKYDVAVIGGGPAGMMAAGTAAANGAKVILIEKNQTLGKKLLITGKGRCNITNAQKDNRQFIKELGPNGPFLFSVLANFNPKQVINFFESHGVKTKVERGGRVFPDSDKSVDVLNALKKYLSENNVTILNDTKVIGFLSDKNSIKKIKLANHEIVAKQYIITTGGLAYPQTGSTGDGYQWAKNLGHSINKPSAALVPILTKEKWVKNLEGLSLKNVNISVYQNNKKIADRFGEALFTDQGMSGPIILDLSQIVGSLLANGETILKINFKPALDLATLDKRIQNDFAQNPNKTFKNSFDELLPKKLIPIFVKLTQINENKKSGQLTREERKIVIKFLTEFTLTVDQLDSFEKAIVTAGGINLKEIDPKTMKSKIINNLFFAGEIIDLNGPTGGFNLQIAFSTGFTAGKNSAIQ